MSCADDLCTPRRPARTRVVDVEPRSRIEPIYDRELRTPGVRRCVAILHHEGRDPVVAISHATHGEPCGRLILFPDAFSLVESAIARWRDGRFGRAGRILTHGPSIQILVRPGDEGPLLCFGRLDPESRERIGKLTVLSLAAEIDALEQAIQLAKNYAA